MEFIVSQIASILNGEIEGDPETVINTISPIETARRGSITFLANSKYEPFLYKTQASAIIIGNKVKLNKSITPTLIRVQDPYMGFTSLLEEYHKVQTLKKQGIEKPVFIGQGCQYGSGFYLGAFSHIGNNVTIGDNVKIFPNSTIGDNTVIDNNTVIYSGVNIYANTKIGSYCVAYS